MSDATFRALVLEQPEGKTTAAVRELARDALPPGDVLVRVGWSTVNYKDGLAITGAGKIVRASYPFVPGIDFAGTVEESRDPAYRPGDAVVLTGWGVGERHWGGLAQLARVEGAWLVPLPRGLSPQQAMGVGTAGLTAMLAVKALEDHGLRPGGRPVVVTGAAGGVGSLAVAILCKLGYEIAASTGRPETHDYLRALGATTIVDRAELASPSSRPLESERWGGAVDTVGGTTLAALLRSLAQGASVAACGNAGGVELNATVFPFILRGVNLLGIDSVFQPREKRILAWERLVHDLPLSMLDQTLTTVPLGEVPAVARAIVDGQVRGRTVVDVNA